MPYDEEKGWIAQPKEYWYSAIVEDAKTLYPSLQWNEGSNMSILKDNESGYYASWDLKVAMFSTKLVDEFATMNLRIQSYDGKAVAGLVRAFLSISYVKQCIIIRAKESDLNCYLFLETMDEQGNNLKFANLTDDQKIELFNMGAETHAITKPRSIYTGTAEKPVTVGYIKGIGAIDGDYQEKGVEVTINEIQNKSLAVMIKVRVIVKDEFVDSLHKDIEVDEITMDFIEQFDKIQKSGVDFLKTNYVCTLKNEDREYMYDFDFYDAENEGSLILMNSVSVEQFEYFNTPTQSEVEVDFVREDGTLIL